MMQSENEIKTDVLVIGGGMAGIFAAIKAGEEGADVTLVDKNYVSRSGSTAFAEGDYSVFNPKWGHDLNAWMSQINMVGEYLNNPEWTEITLRDSIDRYHDFLAWGIKFKEREDGRTLTYGRPLWFGPLECCFLGRGWTFLPAMRRQALKIGVKIVDRVMVTNLLKMDDVIIGAIGFHCRTGDFLSFKAKATVVSTGNGTFDMAGAMTPVGFLSYDGEAMAYRAGAEISGKEFTNVGSAAYVAEKNEEARISLRDKTINTIPSNYPTWVSYGPHISFIDSYVDAEGYRSGRLTAANAVHEGRGPIIYNLDAARPEDLEATLRDIRDSKTEFRLKRVGMDLTKGGLFAGVLRLESTPGHGIFGGGTGISSTSLECATTLPGLFAAGDVYHSRALGASYPAFGFGLRNASVTGARAGRAAAKYASKSERITIDNKELKRLKQNIYMPMERIGGFTPRWVHQQLQNLITPYYIMIVRHGDRLNAALTIVEFLKNQISPKLVAKDAHELRLVHETKNRILCLEMMLRSSLFRTESRALHYREDYPKRDDPNWLALVKIRKKEDAMELLKEPLPKKWWPDLSKPYRLRYPMRFAGED
jgi:succinate dehydrogenase/fumarate reductase flavoprotein subunit